MPSYAPHLRTAIEAATSTRELMREAFGKTGSGQPKTNPLDLVTDIDIRSQTAILDILKRDFPDIPVLAEEGVQQASDEGMLWLVDPLDGTTNFVRGIELFSISICLSAGGEPVAAVVYHPLFDHLYTAARGKGAHLNARQLAVSTTDSLAGFNVSSNLSYRSDERIVIAENIRRLLMGTGGLRMLFSVALELSLVARGSLDAAVVYQANPWDMAAGCLLVREAGGRVTNWKGEDWTIADADCLASNAREHDALLAMLYTAEPA